MCHVPDCPVRDLIIRFKRDLNPYGVARTFLNNILDINIIVYRT